MHSAVGKPTQTEPMSAHISSLTIRLFGKLQREDRVHALSLIGALTFIAVVVIATFPHRPL